MRLLRAASAALLLALTLGLVLTGEPVAARGQDVDQAEEEAGSASERAAQADSLLSEAAGRQADLEDDLAAAIVRLSEINDELTRVSVHLEELRLTLGHTETEMASIGRTLHLRAIEAYVRAVGAPGVAVMGTDDAETAIVAASSVDRLVESDRASVASLTVRRRQLVALREQYVAEQREVTRLQEEADAEAARVEELLSQADAQVAAAAARAREADAAYRAALSELDASRAREAERRRQEQRATTTVTTADVPATTAPPTTSPAADTPPTTTTPVPAPVAGGSFAPSVERWRSLVAAYFPAERVDGALAVVQCESYGDPEAYNPYSGASGLFQFLPSTWATTSPRAGFAGASAFDAEANIGTAAWLSSYYASRGSSPWAPWTCRP